jgi:hypothetical protein
LRPWCVFPIVADKFPVLPGKTSRILGKNFPNRVAPGASSRSAGPPPLGLPDEIAALVVFLIGPDAACIAGQSV